MNIVISPDFFDEILDNNYKKKRLIIEDYHVIFKKYTNIRYINRNKVTYIYDKSMYIIYFDNKSKEYREIFYKDKNINIISYCGNTQKIFYYKYNFIHNYRYIYNIFIINNYCENIIEKNYCINWLDTDNLIIIKKINLCCRYHVNNFLL